VPRPPARPEPLRGRVFRASEALDGGLLTRRQLRSSAWQRLLVGVYADAGLDRTHRLHCRAAALVLPTDAALTGASAAVLYGVELARPDDPVEVLVPSSSHFGPVQGLRVRRAPLPAGDVRTLDDLRVTTPLRTAWEIARGPDPVEATVLLDALAHHGVVTGEQVRGEVARRAAALPACGAGRGGRRARRTAGLLDGRAESPPESRLRVRLVLAGLPPPVPQHVVRLGGRFVARVDLAWPAQRVAGEYDGAWHDAPGPLGRDRRRLNALAAAGWTVLHVTAARLREDPDALAAEVRAALQRATP